MARAACRCRCSWSASPSPTPPCCAPPMPTSRRRLAGIPEAAFHTAIGRRHLSELMREAIAHVFQAPEEPSLGQIYLLRQALNDLSVGDLGMGASARARVIKALTFSAEDFELRPA